MSTLTCQSQTSLQIVHGFIEGGSERQMIQIVSLLHESGDYHVHVASLSTGWRFTTADRTIASSGNRFSADEFLRREHGRGKRRQFVSYLKQHKIRIVHSHDFYSNIFGMTGAALAGVRGRVASKRETTGTRSLAQRNCRTWRIQIGPRNRCECRRGERTVDRRSACRLDKIEIIYNGIDLSRFQQNGNAREALQRLKLERYSWPAGDHNGGEFRVQS